MTTSRPDDIRSSSAVSEDNNYSRIDPDDEDEEDPIIRNIDVFISPELSRTLHLLQFPIQPDNSISKAVTTTPIEAKLRPKHNMLELEYSIPNMALGGGHHHAHHQGDSIHHLTQRTFTSNAITPVTHMALAKLDKTGERLDIIPLQTNVLQMRPSFKHLHNHDEEENNNDASAAQANVDKEATTTNNNSNSCNRQKPIMFLKKESERGAIARRNSYANKRASEESEEWIELDIHGSSSVRKDMLRKVSCTNHHHRAPIRLAETVTDGGYVRSLNYMESISAAFADATDIMMQSATTATTNNDDTGDDTINETAVAEIASKLAVLLQEGNGTMIPYRVLRSNFHPSKVSDEMLIMALSSCAVLVRGNFALKSNLAQFLKNNDVMKEMRDLMLLLLNMYGSISRERLIRAYDGKASTNDEYTVIDADMITFVLETIAKLSNGYWVSKVEDDVVFAARFPQLASYHAAFWMKKKEMLRDLVELYEQ